MLFHGTTCFSRESKEGFILGRMRTKCQGVIFSFLLWHSEITLCIEAFLKSQFRLKVEMVLTFSR